METAVSSKTLVPTFQTMHNVINKKSKIQTMMLQCIAQRIKLLFFYVCAYYKRYKKVNQAREFNEICILCHIFVLHTDANSLKFDMSLIRAS
jgi:hypothetical protein